MHENRAGGNPITSSLSTPKKTNEIVLCVELILLPHIKHYYVVVLLRPSSHLRNSYLYASDMIAIVTTINIACGPFNEKFSAEVAAFASFCMLLGDFLYVCPILSKVHTQSVRLLLLGLRARDSELLANECGAINSRHRSLLCCNLTDNVSQFSSSYGYSAADI